MKLVCKEVFLVLTKRHIWFFIYLVTNIVLKRLIYSIQSKKKLNEKYEIQPGFVLNIFVKNGVLMSQATNQDAFEMIAKGNHKFMPVAFPANLTFIADENGNFTSMLLEQGGQEMEAKKIETKE